MVIAITDNQCSPRAKGTNRTADIVVPEGGSRWPTIYGAYYRAAGSVYLAPHRCRLVIAVLPIGPGMQIAKTPG